MFSQPKLSSRLVSGFRKLFIPANKDRFLRYLNEALFDITEEEIWKARKEQEDKKRKAHLDSR